jgi:hypothetical protein
MKEKELDTEIWREILANGHLKIEEVAGEHENESTGDRL